MSALTLYCQRSDYYRIAAYWKINMPTFFSAPQRHQRLTCLLPHICSPGTFYGQSTAFDWSLFSDSTHSRLATYCLVVWMDRCSLKNERALHFFICSWLRVCHIGTRIWCGCLPLSRIAQCTWLNCVCLSLRQQVVVMGFGPPQPATWSYMHAAGCQPTAPVLSVSLVQSAGTHYRTI